MNIHLHSYMNSLYIYEYILRTFLVFCRSVERWEVPPGCGSEGIGWRLDMGNGTNH